MHSSTPYAAMPCAGDASMPAVKTPREQLAAFEIETDLCP